MTNRDDFPPKPKWKPNLPIDIELTYQKALYYTGGKSQFAIFQNGTIATFLSRVDDIDKRAKQLLEKIFNAHPDCKPMYMDDENYIVQYSNLVSG